MSNNTVKKMFKFQQFTAAGDKLTLEVRCYQDGTVLFYMAKNGQETNEVQANDFLVLFEKAINFVSEGR